MISGGLWPAAVWGGRPELLGQGGTRSGPSRDQVRTRFRDRVVRPLLDAGWLEMTVPDKPRSLKQRYRTTDAMGEHRHLPSPARRSSEDATGRKPDGVGELMLSVPGRPDSEGEVSDLLELSIEPRMRKGDAYLHGRKETLCRPHGRSEIGVPGDDDQGVAGVEVKEIDGFHAQGDVGFLLFEAVDPLPHWGQVRVFRLKSAMWRWTPVSLNAWRCSRTTDGLRIGLVEERTGSR